MYKKLNRVTVNEIDENIDDNNTSVDPINKDKCDVVDEWIGSFCPKHGIECPSLIVESNNEPLLTQVVATYSSGQQQQRVQATPIIVEMGIDNKSDDAQSSQVVQQKVLAGTDQPYNNIRMPAKHVSPISNDGLNHFIQCHIANDPKEGWIMCDQ